MRFAWLAFFLVAVVGCGGSAGGDPNAFKGTYDVTIAGNGKMDTDVLNIDVGANGSVLLDFLYGVSKTLRAQVTGPTTFSIVAQPAAVEHSTGNFDGLVSGMATVDKTGMLKMSLDVSYGLGDGGTPPDIDGGTGVAAFDVEGMRRM